MNVKNRTVFERDNLEIMRGIDSGSIDLIYLDPPFNSNKNYAAPIGGEEAEVAFKDTWTLSDVDDAWHGAIADQDQSLYTVIQAAELAHSKSMKSYLIMMAVRLLEMKRILKDTGSIYLHCDPHASHYLKMIMDSIFGRNNFRNEIVWKRTTAKNNAQKRGRIHDIILYYVQSNKATWNAVYEEHDPEYIRKNYTQKDEHGQYKAENMIVNGSDNSEAGNAWKGIEPGLKGHAWVTPHKRGYAQYIEKNFISGYTKINNLFDRLDALDSAGLIHWPKRGGMPKIKYYLRGVLGRPLQSIINNVNIVRGKESVKYPTQKPLALISQIIESSSNPGDIVLDPFCGTGTTCVAAERLGRQWIGIDLGGRAVELVQDRLEQDESLIAQKVIHRTDIPKPSEKLPSYKTHKHSLYGKQEGVCLGCDTHFQFKNLTVDHIVPAAKGGSDHPDNLQLLCGYCNSSKGSKSQEEFMAAKSKKKK